MKNKIEEAISLVGDAHSILKDLTPDDIPLHCYGVYEQNGIFFVIKIYTPGYGTVSEIQHYLLLSKSFEPFTLNNDKNVKDFFYGSFSEIKPALDILIDSEQIVLFI